MCAITRGFIGKMCYLCTVYRQINRDLLKTNKMVTIQFIIYNLTVLLIIAHLLAILFTRPYRLGTVRNRACFPW